MIFQKWSNICKGLIKLNLFERKTKVAVLVPFESPNQLSGSKMDSKVFFHKNFRSVMSIRRKISASSRNRNGLNANAHSSIRMVVHRRRRQLKQQQQRQRRRRRRRRQRQELGLGQSRPRQRLSLRPQLLEGGVRPLTKSVAKPSFVKLSIIQNLINKRIFNVTMLAIAICTAKQRAELSLLGALSFGLYYGYLINLH